MKIAVCIKQVPTRDWQPRLNDDRTWIREQDASYEMNEPDAYALEEALRLKEKQGGEVVVCSAGPARVAQVHARGAGPRRRSRHPRRGRCAGERRCVRRGRRAGRGDARRAVRPDPDRPAVRRSGIRADRRRSWPSGSACRTRRSSWKCRSASRPAPMLRVKRELEGGWFQWVAMPLPAVLTIQSGINQLRYATLKGIMAAKKKEIRKVAAAAPASAPRQQIVRLYVPEKAKKTRLIRRDAGRGRDRAGPRAREDARVIPVSRRDHDSGDRRAARRQAESRDVGDHRRGAAAGGQASRSRSSCQARRESTIAVADELAAAAVHEVVALEARRARAVHAGRLHRGAAGRDRRARAVARGAAAHLPDPRLRARSWRPGSTARSSPT